MHTSRALQARSVEELRTAVGSGEVPRFVFFWGHRPRRAGQLDRSCFSQWWPAPFDADGESFGSAEQYMMWRKARLFGDASAAQSILAARSPAHAKALGREVHGFDESVWREQRWSIVVAASVAKFRSDDGLLAYLRSTRHRVLVEASPVDRIWGIGLAVDDPASMDPDSWPGLNLLGFALMEARARLDTIGSSTHLTPAPAAS